jgi:hypothetical protein
VQLTPIGVSINNGTCRSEDAAKKAAEAAFWLIVADIDKRDAEDNTSAAYDYVPTR